MMAIPWLKAAFKAIPWRDVVTAAPSIVDGTKRLWSRVARTETTSPANEQHIESSYLTQSDQLAAIENRLRALEERTTEIAREAVSSVELIESLAEQSAQLVEAVENLRHRTHKLVWFTVVLGIAAAFLLAWVTFYK